MYNKLIFELSREGRVGHVLPASDVPEKSIADLVPQNLLRERDAELPQVAENEVVRHFTGLSTLNHHVDKAFYPLGSCTMKYNPKINEKVARLAGFSGLHPEQPEETVQAALKLIYELEAYLKELTGFGGITLQPAAGAQGEMVGLLLMKKYHRMKKRDRKTILVPDSAHGTNPASARVAGFETRTIKSNGHGVVDIDDLRKNLNDDVAGIMLTNPNTLGIFEHQCAEIRRLMDEIDALMYMDGANMNALFGIVRPGDMGFDVMHLNLHKSFSTPHGGGGPGSGPVAVNKKLQDYLPVPVVEHRNAVYRLNYDLEHSIGRVHSYIGNFALLVRAYVYIRMIGRHGFREVAEHAIVNANYLRARLAEHYELGYDSPTMHEFVISAENQRKRGIKAMDIAKRLLDFDVHPPTVYFPLIVKEAIMVEPTETESKEMLDAFAEIMIRIDREIDEQPDIILQAPRKTPVRRLDEAGAVKNLNINYFASEHK